jgi:hypothetical protein
LVKTRRLIQEQDIETIPRESNKIKNWRGQAIFGRRRACSPTETYMYIDLLIDVDNVVRFFYCSFCTLCVFIFLCCPIPAICLLDYPFLLTLRSFLQFPGKVIKLKIDEVRPYLDEDALAALQTTSKYSFARNI